MPPACRARRGFAEPVISPLCVKPAVASAAAVFLCAIARTNWATPGSGLAISKRVSKRAVERNRIKRLLRESFRRVRSQLPPLDLVVMAREQAAGVPGPELLAETRALGASSPPLKRGDDDLHNRVLTFPFPLSSARHRGALHRIATR